MVFADCRKCAFFKPKSRMSISELENAYHYIANYRPKSELLGWCTKYARPVTYYTGKCKGFMRKREALRTLIEFLKVKSS